MRCYAVKSLSSSEHYHWSAGSTMHYVFRVVYFIVGHFLLLVVGVNIACVPSVWSLKSFSGNSVCVWLVTITTTEGKSACSQGISPFATPATLGATVCAVSHRIRILDLELSNICKNVGLALFWILGAKEFSFNQNGLHISANGENVGLNPWAFTKWMMYIPHSQKYNESGINSLKFTILPVVSHKFPCIYLSIKSSGKD